MEMKRLLLILIYALFIFTAMANAYAATITLIMPNQGKDLELGKNSAVAWNYIGYPDTSTVRVTLVKDGTEIGEIAKNVPIKYQLSPSGNGALPNMWKTGALLQGTAPVACGYKVRVYVNGTIGKDESDKTFCIIAAGAGPSLKLTSPNGGEVLKVGDSYKITWNFTGPDSPLRIKLIQGSGYDKGLIANTTTGAKSFDWKVGSFLPPLESQVLSKGSDYKIRIETVTGSFKDESDNAFTVSLPVNLGQSVYVNPALKKNAVAGIGPKSIQITGPPAGSTFKRTEELNITYTFSKNLNDSFIKILLMKIGAPESAAYALTEKKYINSGSFFCYVPSREALDAGSYKIRVKLLNYSDLYADSGVINIIPKEGFVSTYYKAETSNHSRLYKKASNGKSQVTWDVPGNIPDPGSGLIRIGYVNQCHDGNQQNILYRSFIRFDLKEIKGKVKWARLSFVKNDGTVDANKPLYSLNVPWNRSASDLFSVPATPADPNKLGEIVQKWIDDPSINFGLLMAGPNESMPCNNAGHVMILSDVKLDIGITAIY